MISWRIWMKTSLWQQSKSEQKGVRHTKQFLFYLGHVSVFSLPFPLLSVERSCIHLAEMYTLYASSKDFQMTTCSHKKSYKDAENSRICYCYEGLHLKHAHEYANLCLRLAFVMECDFVQEEDERNAEAWKSQETTKNKYCNSGWHCGLPSKWGVAGLKHERDIIQKVKPWDVQKIKRSKETIIWSQVLWFNFLIAF